MANGGPDRGRLGRTLGGQGKSRAQRVHGGFPQVASVPGRAVHLETNC